MGRLFFVLITFFAVAPALSAITTQTTREDELEAETKAWTEAELNPPAYPKPASLVEFAVSGATSNRFLIDADTLSIGADGVVRYVLVVRGAGGAENVSFEGLRCATREQKFYAFGQRGATWSRTRDPQWRFIEYKDVNRQHAVLYADFFCDGRSPFRTVREIAQRLRYPR